MVPTLRLLGYSIYGIALDRYESARRILFSLRIASSHFEADRMNEVVKVVDEALI